MNPYCSVENVKEALLGTPWNADYDALLANLVLRASRAIDRLTKREPGAFAVAAAATRYYNGDGSAMLWIDELAAVPTTVQVSESGVVDSMAGTGGTYVTWSAGDYFCWPYNALSQGVPFIRLDIDIINGARAYWPSFPRSVKVTGYFGFSVKAPDDVVQAAITQTVRWFKRGQQGFQDVGAIAELGQLRYVKDVDPDVAKVIEHLTRTVI